MTGVQTCALPISHQDLQGFLGQIAVLPAVGPAAVLGPGEAPARRVRCFRGAIRHFRKSPSTCSEVRPLSASVLILLSTGSNSDGKDGLALQDWRSEAGPSVGMTRRSLASVVVITHSLRQSSHFPPVSPGI